MTPPIVAPAATPPNALAAYVAVLVDRQRIARLASASATVPKTLTEARTILGAITAEAAQIAATSAQTVSPTGASLAAIKQRAATAKPKNLEEARVAFQDIAKLLDSVSTASAPAAAVGKAPPPTAPAQRPKIEGYAPAPTDAELFAVYQQLKGAARFAYFNIHGAAIWRAYDRRTRSPRGR